MPQFDTLLYFTFFINLIVYGAIFYFVISLILIPFLYNTFNKRFVKKELNVFYSFLLREYYKLVSTNEVFKVVLNPQKDFRYLMYIIYYVKLCQFFFLLKKK